MPELPEVEVIRSALHNTLHNDMLTDIILRPPRLRYPLESHSLDLIGQKLLRITRRAKYMLWHFDTACFMLHLGMSGSVRLTDPEEPWQKHDHIQWQFTQHTARLNDPRRFGFWLHYTEKWQNTLSLLGPEPLQEWDVDSWYTLYKLSPRSIYSLLMDQKVLSGLGNIYAQEALFYSGIHPLRPMISCDRELIRALAEHIIRILRRAIIQGGTTLNDHRRINGASGYFQVELAVYGRAHAPCTQCSAPIESLKIAQRTVSLCPVCQT